MRTGTAWDGFRESSRRPGREAGTGGINQQHAMKTNIKPMESRASRRAFLQCALYAGAAPWLLPSGLLGADGKTAPSGRITLGVIGVGAQGQSDLRDFLRHEDVRVTAICDVNQRNLERARQIIRERYGSPDVKVYADFRELAADATIDAVLMALPVHWHSIPSLEAIRQGKHIYHEKPMAMSFEEARQVRAAARKKGVVFQFGTQQRSDTKFRWACELARNGRLGRLQEIRVSVPAGRESAIGGNGCRNSGTRS